jgi:acetyl-CoA carboxylase carboxyl transferase subunit beta
MFEESREKKWWKGKVPPDLWMKCPECENIIYKPEVLKNFKVCPKCNYHFRLSWKEWIEILIDKDSFEEKFKIKPFDILGFKDTVPYESRLKSAQESTGAEEAIVTGKGKINNRDCFVGIFEFSFMGGSMGVVVGEKIASLFENAINENLPVLLVISSGGARMQEGMFSLMQMAKTVAAVSSFKKNCKKPYISVLSDPTTGGVAASFAFLADIVIAEPKSLIGFAGPRVIEQTIGQTLPPGFQKAEFLLEKGMVDLIVERKELKNKISKLFHLLTK